MLNLKLYFVFVIVFEKSIGIDLGSRNSVVGFLEGVRLGINLKSDGGRRRAWVVGFRKEGEVVVGEIVKREVGVNWINTFLCVKGFIGGKMLEVWGDFKELVYDVVEGFGGGIKIKGCNVGKRFFREGTKI